MIGNSKPRKGRIDSPTCLYQILVNRALAKTGGDQDAEYGKVLLTNARDILTQYLMKCRKEYAARKIRTGAEAEVKSVFQVVLPWYGILSKYLDMAM